jgi:hypothetical protein
MLPRYPLDEVKVGLCGCPGRNRLLDTRPVERSVTCPRMHPMELYLITPKKCISLLAFGIPPYSE